MTTTAVRAAPVDVAAANAEAQSALRAVVHAVAVAAPRPATPRERSAVAGAYAGLWTCRRLAEASQGPGGAAPVAAYLAPRLLLDGADGLAAALGDRLYGSGASSAAYRRHVRKLAEIAATPGAAARTREVAARLPALVSGDDRLARPLTAVSASALARPLRELVGALEEERRAVVARVADPGPAGIWALADRYALLSAAAVCLDGWRMPGAPRRRRSGDRMCLVGALSRLASGLPAASVTGGEWRDEVYEAALVCVGEDVRRGAGAQDAPTRRAYVPAFL